jgi:hypothetical protein
MFAERVAPCEVKPFLKGGLTARHARASESNPLVGRSGFDQAVAYGDQSEFGLIVRTEFL